MTSRARSRAPNFMSRRPTWVFAVERLTCSRDAISVLDRPRPISVRTSRSRSVMSPAAAGGRGRGSGCRVNSSMSRRVTAGASSASPAATTRIASSRSAGRVSLSRKPLAPARSAPKTYSSRSNVVRISQPARPGHRPARRSRRRARRRAGRPPHPRGERRPATDRCSAHRRRVARRGLQDRPPQRPVRWRGDVRLDAQLRRPRAGPRDSRATPAPGTGAVPGHMEATLRKDQALVTRATSPGGRRQPAASGVGGLLDVPRACPSRTRKQLVPRMLRNEVRSGGGARSGKLTIGAAMSRDGYQAEDVD